MPDDRRQLGDMPVEEFRRFGHELIDWIADYLAHPERYPVLSKVNPGYLKDALPESAPQTGEPMAEILADLDRLIVPGVTHWNHPSFFAYFSTSGSGPGILGEMLSAAFNVNAMLWRTSPAATELEEVTLDWLRQMIGLPEDFSGVIYDTGSISTLCAIAAAREAVSGIDVREKGLAYSRESSRTLPAPAPPRLRLYANEHAHSSVDKAAITLGLGHESLRKIETDSEFRMDPRALERAIEEDREDGLAPFLRRRDSRNNFRDERRPGATDSRHLWTGRVVASCRRGLRRVGCDSARDALFDGRVRARRLARNEPA